MKKKAKIAVIVGRFQVPQLTSGHFWLIQTAFCNFDKVVVLIGDTKVLPNGFKRMDSHDPFPYDLRAKMISSYIREYIPFSMLDKLLGIHRFEDIGNLPLWNSKLDDFLETINPDPNSYEFVMVGSRDSFATKYSGKNKVQVLESQLDGISARQKTFEELSKNLLSKGEEFREGVLWAVMEMERLKNLNNDGEKT